MPQAVPSTPETSGRPGYRSDTAGHRARTNVVVARAIPGVVPTWERERLLTMVDILESLPPEEIRALALRSAFIRLDARAVVLVTPEEHEERLFLLLEGRAQVCEEGPTGRELTISVIEDGMLVGATGFAPRLSWGLRVEALEPSLFCEVSRRAFEELLGRNPTLGMRVSRLLGERLVEAEARLADLARKEVPERLASQILRLVESQGLVTPEGYKIPAPYTHRQLAAMIGANRESVTRAFKRLRSEGGVESSNGGIFVADLDALRRIAQS